MYNDTLNSFISTLIRVFFPIFGAVLVTTKTNYTNVLGNLDTERTHIHILRHTFTHIKTDIGQVETVSPSKRV